MSQHHGSGLPTREGRRAQKRSVLTGRASPKTPGFYPGKLASSCREETPDSAVTTSVKGEQSRSRLSVSRAPSPGPQRRSHGTRLGSGQGRDLVPGEGLHLLPCDHSATIHVERQHV